jgi:hypothetical protein
MFVTDKLVYLQLQKTGCTHIVRVMKDLVGGSSTGRKHGRVKHGFPLEGRRIVGSIRDPWSWYVSLWAYGCGRSGAIYDSTTSRRLRKHFANRRKNPDWLDRLRLEVHKPTGQWKRLYADSDNPALFRDWLRMVLDPRRADDLGQRYGDSGLRGFAGLLTYRYLRLYALDTRPLFAPSAVSTLEALRAYDRQQNVTEFMIRNESLEDDLMAILRRVGHTVDASAEARLRAAHKTNASRHRPASDYYDRETIDLVAEKEAFIIGKYGYERPGTARPTPSPRVEVCR